MAAGLVCRMDQEDFLLKQYDEEQNPITKAIHRGLDLSALADQDQIKAFNLTVMIGPHFFKMSDKVKNWIKVWDSNERIFQFNNFAFPPIKNLIIDFVNKEIRFEDES